MKPIRQHVWGRLLEENGRFALWLSHAEPAEITAESLYLGFALVTLGTEEHIFPAFVLDDWGHEIRGLDLYEWIVAYGQQFPRGELFGYEQDGRETQCFLRGLELYVKYPCYVYTHPAASVHEGVAIQAILLPTEEVDAPQQIKKPLGMKRPLRNARVTWWQIPAHSPQVDLHQILFGK
ncbi:MAG: hypothetical protein D6706_13730 [Chloroflexi bacterium]|nr:MAG: hypothetical protein D6706_13730 [Chloroflexota bacterium]